MLKYSLREEFLNQFKNVFNNNNTLKICDKVEYIKLIFIANLMTNTSDYGCTSDCTMNINNILKLHNNLEV